MPTTQALPTPDLFFTTLQELDDYRTRKLSERPSPNRTTPWTSRKTVLQGSQGKLLVCHDYKGGYVEDPQGLSYTFNYWSLTDSFSHHRVTIPPPGWVNAAHRQGVKMLGVLIFEGGAEAECLQLLTGQLPQSSTGSAIQSFVPSKLSISPHYAVALADLAAERGFDGYLMNFECWLTGGIEQARALAAWLGLLQSELIQRVGPHAEWPPDYCDTTANFFLSVDPDVLGLATEERSKTLHDVYMGVDIWGRGSYGGGGFGAYKAINHIAPATLGLSVALFAQGWTWEAIEGEPGFTWDVWWQNERNLWAGFTDPSAAPPESDDSEGPYKPLSTFFQHLPPPDPIDVPFNTTFCPGVGLAWFIEGTSVSQFSKGWMDVDKQTTMGDLLWPAPALQWESATIGTVPDVVVSVNMTDSWNSGSSVQLDFSEKTANPNLTNRSFYAPIQVLSLTTQRNYTASIIYKPNKSTGSSDVDLDVILAIRPRDTTLRMEVKVAPESIKTSLISNNWTRVTMQFVTVEDSPTGITVDNEIGIIINTVSSETTPFSLSLLLGQINVHATPSATIEPNFPRILCAEFTTTTMTVANSKSSIQPSNASTENTTLNLTTISWTPSTSLSQVGPININSPDDPNCVWTPEPPFKNQWFPGFLYYNIFAAEPGAAIRALAKVRRGGGSSRQHVLSDHSESGMIWIGTSGADGSVGKGRLEFSFDRTQLPAVLRDLTILRVFVQGVLETGEVLSWENSAYVDVQF
ncbi:hypothetical protein Ac2012v2_003562 [Leucoagaricus gongylophorus]